MIVALHLTSTPTQEDELLCAQLQRACDCLENAIIVSCADAKATQSDQRKQVLVNVLCVTAHRDAREWKEKARALIGSAYHPPLLIVCEAAVAEECHQFARTWNEGSVQRIEAIGVRDNDQSLAIKLAGFVTSVLQETRVSARTPTPRPDGRLTGPSTLLLTQTTEGLPERFRQRIGDMAADLATDEFTALSEQLHGIISIADFVEQLFAPPAVAPLQNRTEFREDAALLAVNHQLGRITYEPLRILDVGCGFGNLPEALLRSLNPQSLGRIHYTGIDIVQEHVNRINQRITKKPGTGAPNSAMRDHGAFASSEAVIASAVSLGEEHVGKYDLVFCSNLLHEISPLDVPAVLFNLNTSLASSGNSACLIIDMERLPNAYPEYCAFTWNRREFQGLLEAMGYSPTVMSIPKGVPVLSADLEKQPQLSLTNGIEHAKRVVVARRNELLQQYQTLLARQNKDADTFINIVGLLAAIAHTLQCLQSAGHDQ